MRPLETASVFFTGALGYWALELLWRGHTHWTMPLTGGVCLIMIYIIANFTSEALWKKWVMCACCVTTAEFLVGIVVNLRLGWAVWDYSSMPMNLYGQICPLFTMFWALLAIPCVFLCNILRYFVFIPLYRRGDHSP